MIPGSRWTLRCGAARALAVVAVVASVPIASSEPAMAWTEGACPTADGVTVVVDFQELGGGVYVRCAPGASSTGFEALQRAGIDYRTTIRFPGFLCRIADKPSSDHCIDASPASAYWSYWLAPRGGQWCYSNWGAGNRNPPEGSVEGWSFSLDKGASAAPSPRIVPPAAVAGSPLALPADDCDGRSTAPQATATTAPSTASTTVTAQPDTGGSSASSAAGPSSSSVPAVGATTAPGAAAGVDELSESGSIGSTPSLPEAAVDGSTTTPGQPGDHDVDGDDAENPDGQDGQDAHDEEALGGVEQTGLDLSGDGSGAGSPWPVFAGLVLIVLVGGGAWMVRRRGVVS